MYFLTWFCRHQRRRHRDCLCCVVVFSGKHMIYLSLCVSYSLSLEAPSISLLCHSLMWFIISSRDAIREIVLTIICRIQFHFAFLCYTNGTFTYLNTIAYLSYRFVSSNSYIHLGLLVVHLFIGKNFQIFLRLILFLKAFSIIL